MLYRFYRREFLNKPGFQSIGYILAAIEKSTCKKKNSWPGSMELTIGDCNRHISIDLDIDSPEDRDNTLYKLDLLLDSLIQVRKAVLEEIEVQLRREAKVRKSKDANSKKNKGDTGDANTESSGVKG